MRSDTGINLQGQTEQDAQAVCAEKQEEMKLMNKLASSGGLPAKGPTAFLQKRLNQRKFFDSGDYAMDKEKAKKQGKGGLKLPGRGAPLADSTEKRPPPAVCQGALNVNVQGLKVSEEEGDVEGDVAGSTASASPTGLEIPRPETVPQRKSSIIYPSAHSKLSPQPHLHHPPDSLSPALQAMQEST